MALGIVAASLWPLSVEAKCASKRFRITVTAVDHSTGRPLAGATVVVFANDELAAWPTDYVNYAEAKATDAAGVFESTFYFNTASGGSTFWGYDACHRKLKKLEVVVVREGYVPARVVLTRFPKPAASGLEESHIHVPSIPLEPAK